MATIDMKMWIQQDNTAPGITFTASYTAVSPPPSLGAGIRPFGRVCAFGLFAGQLHFIKGAFDTTSTCRSTVQGRMILRPGMATRLAKTPDFWVTSETAMAAGSQKSKIAEPLGVMEYPSDTRIPVRWNAGWSTRGTNRTLGLLGISGFPMHAVSLPHGVNASMTVYREALVGGASAPTPTAVPAHDGPATVPCHTVILEGGLVCYPPQSQALAESRLAVRPIDPVAGVEATTQLQLTQLRLFYGFLGNRGVNLLYGFGKVCWSSEFVCATRYLVVGEAPGPSPVTGPRMMRDREASSRSGVRNGPWKFLAPVPHRNLVVTVYGPFPKHTIRAIGMGIIRAHT